MATHTFDTKPSPIDAAHLDAALAEAAASLPYYPHTVTTKTTTPYQLVLADGNPNARLRMNLAGDCQVTVPDHATVAFVAGTRVPIDQWGEGQVHVVGAAGVQIRRAKSAWTYRQYSRAWLEYQGSDEWLLEGDLEPIFSSP